MKATRHLQKLVFAGGCGSAHRIWRGSNAHDEIFFTVAYNRGSGPRLSILSRASLADEDDVAVQHDMSNACIERPGTLTLNFTILNDFAYDLDVSIITDMFLRAGGSGMTLLHMQLSFDDTVWCARGHQYAIDLSAPSDVHEFWPCDPCPPQAADPEEARIRSGAAALKGPAKNGRRGTTGLYRRRRLPTPAKKPDDKGHDSSSHTEEGSSEDQGSGVESQASSVETIDDKPAKDLMYRPP